MNKLFTLGRRVFDPPKGQYVLSRAESRRCKVNTLGILVCNFSIFFKVSQTIQFRKSITEYERSD